MEEHQVQLASFHLKRTALQWFRWLVKTKGPASWAEFTRALLKRFRPTELDDASKACSNQSKKTTVLAYQEECERLSQMAQDVPESFLIGSFVGGFKDKIRLELQIQKPQSLSTAIGLVRLIEKKCNLCNQPSKIQSTTPQGLLGSQPRYSTPSTFKRLIPSEVKERKDCGLCYYCDGKYSPSQSRCKT